MVGSWHSLMEQDPFDVPLDEKVALLVEATRRMQTVKGLAFAEAATDLYRRRTWLDTSEGTAIEQTIVHSGGGIEATAIGDGELQRRSFPNSFRGTSRRPATSTSGLALAWPTRPSGRPPRPSSC